MATTGQLGKLRMMGARNPSLVFFHRHVIAWCCIETIHYSNCPWADKMEVRHGINAKAGRCGETRLKDTQGDIVAPVPCHNHDPGLATR